MKSSRGGNGMKGLGLVLVLGVGLVGCAVLTVDVDVYKGALVNEEHVQLHQLTALATAAKPMLVQLRDTIEWPALGMPEETAEHKKEWYESEYIPPPKRQPPSSKHLVPPQRGWWCKRTDLFCSKEVLGYPYFSNVMAVRVNEVLGLYETLDEQGGKIRPTDMLDQQREKILPTNMKAGLTYRIDHYLKQSLELDHSIQENHYKYHKLLVDAEHELIDALVEFASKVLFLANHEGLLSPPDTPGLILGGAEKLNRGLFGDFITDRSMYAFLNSDLVRDKQHQYVRVLQAVGNSILFSANELRERERYREQGQKKVDAEVNAANWVYSPSPTKVFDDLLRELELQKIVAQTELTTARTQKAQIGAQIGSAVAPKSGLHLKKETATSELTKAEQDLNDYRSKHGTLEAIHHILTDAVSKQIKALWSTGQQDSADENDFLIGNDGLKDKIAVVQTARDGIPPTGETRKWNDAILYVESSDARQAFKAYRATERLTTLKRADLLDHFIAYLRWSEANRAKHVTEYETTRKEKSEVLRNRTEDITTLSAEVIRLGERISKIPGEIDELTTSMREIESIKADVLKEADRRRQFVSPEAMYLLISSHLERRTTPDGQTAQKILSTRTPPPGMPPLDLKDYKNPMEVMDAVIALLRHRQMEAVERFGKGSSETEKATEALENAYRHRAGMIYIRPSSAYLRTSFPSTSLQDDPNLAWDNMLLKQGLRNLPFSSELRDILNPTGKQDRLITSELDKQYWQNINRVRVSGAGATNQALVKDDVGNWYVKQYFGKTDQIWESAKNLALFSMSAKVPIDLAKQLNKASTPEEYAENSKETPTLQKVLEKHQSAYQTHTDEVKVKLERLHDRELKEMLIAAWDAHKDLRDDTSFNAEIKQALEAELVVWKTVATALKEKEGQDPGQAIVKDVGALARLGKMLSASITKISSSISSSAITQEEMELDGKQKKLADEPDIDKLKTKKAELEEEKQNLSKKKAELERKRKAAVFEVHKVVGGQVTGILTERDRVLEQYEQAIVFIGDAAKPEETKAK
ncbi:MAG TPA: hypothetical protein PKD12_12755 [Nitrospira sp.]|nr:hypothetical protein [Nitrospira sp.]